MRRTGAVRRAATASSRPRGIWTRRLSFSIRLSVSTCAAVPGVRRSPAIKARFRIAQGDLEQPPTGLKAAASERRRRRLLARVRPPARWRGSCSPSTATPTRSACWTAPRTRARTGTRDPRPEIRMLQALAHVRRPRRWLLDAEQRLAAARRTGSVHPLPADEGAPMTSSCASPERGSGSFGGTRARPVRPTDDTSATSSVCGCLDAELSDPGIARRCTAALNATKTTPSTSPTSASPPHAAVHHTRRQPASHVNHIVS